MNIINIKDKNINGDLMIENYLIKYESNEEVLYLYLNYNYEFGAFNKGKSFFQELKKLLNNKYINFKGNKIVLVVSGIVIGTIFLNNIDYKKYDNNLDNYQYINQVVLNDFNSQEEFIIPVNKNEVIIDNSSNNSEINNINEKNISQNGITNDNIIQNTNQTNINLDNNKPNNEITYTDTNINTNIYTITDTTINNNEIVDDENTNQTIVTIYRSNGEILNIELEEYIIGVVAGEMPASFNMEALKVQAIIARTYALKSMENNKLLTDTTSTQVYIDKQQMYQKWGSDFNKYFFKIKEAVNSTEGMIITYDNELIDAVYFANSNGYTEDAKEVWGYNIPYLKSVESPYDINTTRYKKVVTKSYDEVSNILGFNVDENVEIYNILKNNSNRVTSITINDKTYTGIEFRNLFSLNSADFEIEITNVGLTITTYGYGHGVGVSQYGANGMANQGYNFEDIINYYYKNVTLNTK